MMLFITLNKARTIAELKFFIKALGMVFSFGFGARSRFCARVFELYGFL
jgi:hypothetical protein